MGLGDTGAQVTVIPASLGTGVTERTITLSSFGTEAITTGTLGQGQLWVVGSFRALHSPLLQLPLLNTSLL